MLSFGGSLCERSECSKLLDLGKPFRNRFDLVLSQRTGVLIERLTLINPLQQVGKLLHKRLAHAQGGDEFSARRYSRPAQRERQRRYLLFCSIVPACASARRQAPCASSPVVTENLNSKILMMKPAQDRNRHDLTD